VTSGSDFSGAVAATFDGSAAAYDAARTRLVPCLDRLYGAAVALLPFAEDASAGVLDLGAGTGLLAMRVLAAYPKARLRLVDVGGAMLAVARVRLAGAAHPPEIAVADYARAPLGGPYDAIVSALSIHRCDDEAKRGLFGRCRDALAPGGVFVNADQVGAPTAALDAAYDRAWLDGVRRAGATEAEIAAARARRKEERYAPLAAQLGWLAEAGFEDVDCWFKDGRFVVYAGRKPA
jgi:tRNA (cmo5U34)-methyltransferase